jgi:hypothetical protein
MKIRKSTYNLKDAHHIFLFNKMSAVDRNIKLVLKISESTDMLIQNMEEFTATIFFQVCATGNIQKASECN